MNEEADQPGASAARSATSLRRRRRRMPALAMLPSMLTLGNAVCGFAGLVELAQALAFARQGMPDDSMLHMTYAALLVGGGMACDGLDGKVARMTGTSGRFGAELDSLCDAVTFGIVPAMFLRVFGEFLYVSRPVDSKVLWAASAIYACCAILRLARFNVETDEDDDHLTFRGLPSPAAAASVISLFLGISWFWQNVAWFREEPVPSVLRIALPLAGAFIGLMMVTRVRYVHVFNRMLNRKRSFGALVAAVFLILGGVLLGDYWQLLVPSLILVYVLSGPAYFAWRFMRGRGLLGRKLLAAERRKQRRERERTAGAREASTGSSP